ncbi:cholesterol transporter ABCA5-like isoform X4 [Oscarella lobularis]|uniref:cholesterol transporter ABCA5-like isoform X4 n=1 Tax=Oscarella lobularis TaxID=121494 RepID=UPI0033134785
MGTWTQTVYLLKRNYWIKTRNKRQSVQELLYPVYLVAILALIRAFVETSPLKPLRDFPCQGVAPPLSHNFSNDVIGVSGSLELVRNATRRFLPPLPQIVAAENGSELESFYRKRQITIGIEFNASMTSYVLRFAADVIANTNDMETSLSQCRDHDQYIGNYSGSNVATDCPAFSYVTSGFAVLQSALDSEIIRRATGNEGETVFRSRSCLFPKRKYYPSIVTLQIMISLYMVAAFSPLVNFLLINLVTEKEKKLKVGMQMMGLSDAAFWLSWFLTYAIVTAVTILIVVVISTFALFPNSNFFLLLLLFLAYGLSIISFSFMLTPFFDRAIAAGGLGSLMTIVFGVLVIPAIFSDLSASLRWALSLISPAAFALGLNELIILDNRFGGLTFGNFVSTSLGSYSVGSSVLMLFLDAILYWFLAFYFDNIVPTKYGRAKSPLFCFESAFWKTQSSLRWRVPSDRDISLDDGDNLQDNVAVENVSSALKSSVAIRISSLRKEFVDKEKQKNCSKQYDATVTALAGLSLTVYEGQITALLGHNGAGKSTLIACLTGLTKCTSGGATVYNLDINNPIEIDEIRQRTGVCLQHDLLFENLTVREHLIVFSGIKGIPKEEIGEKVRMALEEVGLEKERDAYATKLSGGQKRKLSVAIALIGNPKILFLDEPTSGMDPYSRRQLWSLLKSKKEGRVIFLTTQFMDEADILADRKAVLSRGKLQCVGSSLFLKSRFGIGYHLGQVISFDVAVYLLYLYICIYSVVLESNGDVDAVTDVVKRNVPDAQMTRSRAGDLSYTLPLKDVPLFPQLFASLEAAPQLGIRDFGVSMTSLEEVFLHLEELEAAKENEKEEEEEEKEKEDAIQTEVRPDDYRSSILGSSLLWQQFKAMLWLRLLVTLRNGGGLFFRGFVGPIMVIVAVVVGRHIAVKIGQPQSLPLNASIYLTNQSRALGDACRLPGVDVKPALMLNNASNRYPRLIEELRRQSTGFCFPGVDFSRDGLDRYLLNSSYEALAVDVSAVAPFDFSLFYNDTLVHSLPIGINVMSNVYYRNLTQSSEGIAVTNYPFPYENPPIPFDGDSYVFVLIVGIAFLLTPSSFGLEIVQDREVRARHQLHVSGLRRIIYWLSTLSIHLIAYVVPVLILLILIPAMNIVVFCPPPSLGLLALVFLLSLPVQALFVYAVSYLFNKAETVLGIMPSVVPALGILPYIVVALLYHKFPTLMIALHYVFMFLLPPYLPLGCMWFLTVVYQKHKLDPSVNDLSAATYFSFSSNISPGILIILFHAALFSFLVAWLDKRSIDDKSFCSCFSILEEAVKESSPLLAAPENVRSDGDDDVEREEGRARENTGSKGVPILVNGLGKDFAKNSSCRSPWQRRQANVKVAVKSLSVKVEKGEILGLLGPNGAGKTTTLSVFTGRLIPTRGKVYLDGEELGDGLDAGRAAFSLGYCPQIDALWPTITFEEHLKIYSLIKGVDPRSAVWNDESC